MPKIDVAQVDGDLLRVAAGPGPQFPHVIGHSNHPYTIHVDGKWGRPRPLQGAGLLEQWPTEPFEALRCRLQPVRPHA